MSGNRVAQIMQDALAHARHDLTAYKRLELVQTHVEEKDHTLTEVEIVHRTIECGDCD